MGGEIGSFMPDSPDSEMTRRRIVSSSSRSRSILVRYLVLAERIIISISREFPPFDSSSVDRADTVLGVLYRGGGGVIVVEELLRRVMGSEVNAEFRSLMSFAGVVIF